MGKACNTNRSGGCKQSGEDVPLETRQPGRARQRDDLKNNEEHEVTPKTKIKLYRVMTVLLCFLMLS